ncbi:MAG: hypothetical protein K0S09_751 [Sphingobacteriaceae bacterium]|jgi:endonuclease/exonuclease/phosphatase (EEP) superfamily protein YafD|nr:hypothetical protein [Sphingobacteriaceae bacterium]
MEIVLAVISLIVIISVFLSLIKNDYWIFKVLEYPRFQKLIVSLCVSAGWFVWQPDSTFQEILVCGLTCSIIYLVYKIWPYTLLSKKEMVAVREYEGDDAFGIFAANVLQDNQDYERLVQQIEAANPDVIFLLETNLAWANAVRKTLDKSYPYQLLYPLENTYGLLFYSRLELEREKILFRVKDDIPSIEAVVKLPSGRKFQLYGLHPEPPVPGESLTSTAKDKELMKVAFEVKKNKLPCLVIGDLNDVAWSYTTELFRKTSELLDPRRGRGFYNTFSAHHWFIRFPLDYVFCSKEFGLVSMKRMPKNGSDHFATLTHLALTRVAEIQQEATRADDNELKEAKEIAEQPVDKAS